MNSRAGQDWVHEQAERSQGAGGGNKPLWKLPELPENR